MAAAEGADPGLGAAEGPGLEPGLGAAEGPGLDAAEGPGLEPGLGAAEGPGLGAAEGPGLDAAEGPGLEPGLDTAEGPGLGAAEGPGLEPGLDTAEGPGLGAAEGPGLDAAEGPGLDAAEGPGLEPGLGAAEGPGLEPGLGAAEGPGLEPGLGAAEGPGLGAAEGPGLEPGLDAAEGPGASGPGAALDAVGPPGTPGPGDAAELERAEERLRRLLCRCEPPLIFLQNLLVWERPAQSGLMLLGLSGLFWLFSSTSLRPFFLISLSVLAIVFLDHWKSELLSHIIVQRPMDEGESDGNSTRPRLLTLPDLCHHLAESCVAFNLYLKEVLDYKRQNPGKFCLKMCLGCSAFAAVGHYIPGIMISYIFKKAMVKLESCDEPTAETESESEAELSSFNSKVDVRTTALAFAITDSELSDEEASILESGGFSMSRGTTPQLSDVSEDLDQQSMNSEPEEAFSKDLPEFPSVEDLAEDGSPSLVLPGLSLESSISILDPQFFIQTLSSPLHFVNTHFNGNEAAVNQSKAGQVSALSLNLDTFSEEIGNSTINTVLQNTLSVLLSNPLTGSHSEDFHSQQKLSRAGSMDLEMRGAESHQEVDDFELLDQGELDQMDKELGLNEQLRQADRGQSTWQLTETELLRKS
ncbi:reticulophagy regulator 2 isoform X2 [Scyliorhinus torazame]|uniref:reticulophagy regulator 2 isoform X2 n=1 Tax=Scyliorhinus torazame TaxID=75743 RepID=UPI003B5BAC96